MVETSSEDGRPTTREGETAAVNARREFLKKAGAGAALLAAGGAVAGAAVRGALGAAASTARAAEAGAERSLNLTQARAALQTARRTVPGGAEGMPDSVLAEIADATGRRADKLSTGLPAGPVFADASATAVSPVISENILLRMQRDLQRAMAKPVALRRWAMVIDIRKCIGCSACTVACKAENKLPPGVVYRPVLEQELGEYPHVSRRFTPRPCMQCENPPCVSVCPVGATYKRPDGIVEINYQVCIGCRYCIAACPYGARTFDFGNFYTDPTPERQAYEELAAFEYGRSWPRTSGVSPVGNARKCQFCLHRLAEGMLPACTTTCVGAATFFGDKGDPESLVSELIAMPNIMRLKEELGTSPKVYYLA